MGVSSKLIQVAELDTTSLLWSRSPKMAQLRLPGRDASFAWVALAR
jgi:hypothetical protein